MNFDKNASNLGNMPPTIVLSPKHKRTQVLGGSGNLVTGSWLFKLELAQKRRVALGRKDLAEQLARGEKNPKSWETQELTQSMVGFDYTGVMDLTVSGGNQQYEN